MQHFLVKIPKDKLLAAANVLERPEAWIRNNLAVDQAKRTVSPESHQACSWCVVGALMKCGYYPPTMDCFQLISWNNSPGQTQDNIVAALRAASKES